LVEALDLLK